MMDTKFCNTDLVPTWFMPFIYVWYCTCCVTEWCIWLSSIFFSYACAGLWDRSNSVRQCPKLLQYCSSISEHCPEDETLQTQFGGGQHAVSGDTVLNVQQQLLASPVKSFCHLSEETGMSYSLCERSTRKGRIHPYCGIVVHTSNLQICRKEWPSASGFKHLFPKTSTSWTWYGFLMKLCFTYVCQLTEYMHVGCYHSWRLLHQQKVGVWCAL